MPIADLDVWLTKLRLVLISAFIFSCSTAPAQAPAATPAPNPTPGYYGPLPQDTGKAGLTQELRKLQTTGRLMMVTAHPDDEDGGLLTYEARGKGVQTLLMTLTRGEGGQNKTGDTFSDELGILRTLELLAADRYYGVEQRFSRVADFGFSKSADETFQKWGGHDVPLADIVRVIREFRPDVLIARFSGTDRDGHGHHQASAILTKEAFRAAADPNRFPEQIKEGLQPWQAKKLYIGNVCGFGASTCPDENYTIKINTGEEDPALGMSYSQFAIEGLRHQESQGLGDLRIPSGPRYAFYKLEDSVLPKTTDVSGHEKDLFDGIDTSLSGLAKQTGTPSDPKLLSVRHNLEEASIEVDKAAASGAGDSDTVAGAIVRASRELMAADSVRDLPFDDKVKQRILSVLRVKQHQVERAIGLAMNVSARAEVALPGSVTSEGKKVGGAAFSPGSKLKLSVTLDNRSKYRLFLAAVSEGYSGGQETILNHSDYWGSLPVQAGSSSSVDYPVEIPENARYSRSYWHRTDPARESVNEIDDQEYATLPFPLPAFKAGLSYMLDDAAQVAVLGKPPNGGKYKHNAEPGLDAVVLSRYADSIGAERKMPPAIVPIFSVSLEPAQQVLPLADGRETNVKVDVSSNLDGAPSGTLHLDLPNGWHAEPSKLNVNLPKRGDAQEYLFKVFPANITEGRTQIHAILDAGGKQYSEAYTLVTREDLGSFYYFEPAVQHISIVDVKILKDLKVGYIMGAGDDIPTVLQQVGMNVTLIPAEKIAAENLAQYGTIILGVRAYDTQKDLVTNNQKLLDFVSNGGTLIVQNNNSLGDFNSEHLTPYPLELSRARVSVEEAPVQVLEPDNPIFHYPNEITQKDFDRWVQERGLYFADSWDDHFKALLSCHDPGESDQKGGMLEAKFGKGIYVFTGYSFFRQLPAGVPGAIRLFVNLVSAGHQQ